MGKKTYIQCHYRDKKLPVHEYPQRLPRLSKTWTNKTKARNPSIDNGIPRGEQEYILEEEVDALIHQAIGTLPRQAQKMVIMTLNGDSNLEIAQKLNITVNTVKSTKLKAYQILRKRLRNVQWLLVLLT